MIHIPSLHPKISSIIASFQEEKYLDGCYQKFEENTQTVFMDEYIQDFGCRYRLIGHRVLSDKADVAINNRKEEHLLILAIHVCISEWDKLKMIALPSLRSLFGDNMIREQDINNDPRYKKNAPDTPHMLHIPDLGKVCAGYNFSIEIEARKIANYINLLPKIRTVILGAKLKDVFLELCSGDNKLSSRENGHHVYSIPIYTTLKQGRCGECVVSSHPDRVTVVFIVDFDDDTARAIARLCLKEFSRAQQRSSRKKYPICEYRRACDAPREIASQYPQGSTDAIAGFLSFTFLEGHVKNETDLEKVVELMISFLTYIDYHIKCTKSYIRNRMVQKHKNLLGKLHCGWS